MKWSLLFVIGIVLISTLGYAQWSANENRASWDSPGGSAYDTPAARQMEAEWAFKKCVARCNRAYQGEIAFQLCVDRHCR